MTTLTQIGFPEEPLPGAEANDYISGEGFVPEGSDTEASDDSGAVQEDRGVYSHKLLKYHRDAFYAAYKPEWEKASRSSHLISKEKYDEIVQLLRTKREKKEPGRYVKYRATYSLCSNVDGRCLYRKCNKEMKVVSTYENVFDIILEAHVKGRHAKCNYFLFFLQCGYIGYILTKHIRGLYYHYLLFRCSEE